MNNRKQKMLFSIGGVLAVVLVIVIIVVVRMKPWTSETALSPVSEINDFPESFSFYHLEANSPLNDQFIQKFDKIFGSHAITRKTTLDLGIRKDAVLSEKLPALDQLDRNLNGDANERVEHDTTLITYRYFPEKTKFFQNVKLWFANSNLKPLMVDIKVDYHGRYLIDNIEKKYGPGEVVTIDKGADKLLYWELEKDYLMVLNTRDRYGDDLYYIKIYYVNNMNALYLNERKNKKSPEPVFF